MHSYNSCVVEVVRIVDHLTPQPWSAKGSLRLTFVAAVMMIVLVVFWPGVFGRFARSCSSFITTSVTD